MSGARLAATRPTPVEARGAPWTSIVALGTHALRRMLGLRRRTRAKVLPFGCAALAYLPAIVFIALAVLFPQGLADELIPEASEYYGIVIIAVVLLTALVGPAATTPDRRHRTLDLLLTGQVGRAGYLVATGGALVVALLVVTVGPVLLVEVGTALLGVPGDALWLRIGRALLSGLVLAVPLAAVSLAISSTTANRGFAAAGTFLAFIGLTITSSVLVEVLDLPAAAAVVDVLAVTLELLARVARAPSTTGLDAVHSAVVLAAWTAWSTLPVLAAAVLLRRAVGRR